MSCNLEEDTELKSKIPHNESERLRAIGKLLAISRRSQGLFCSMCLETFDLFVNTQSSLYSNG